jgi:hypothetical protein
MAKERVLFRCPLCSKVSPRAAFEAGERGDDTHALGAKVVTFIGGGREGRPMKQARDGRMVLLRDEEGKTLPGRGFDWSARDLTLDERAAMVRMARAAAERERVALMRDLLMSAPENQFEDLCAAFEQDALADYSNRVEGIAAIRQKRYYDE